MSEKGHYFRSDGNGGYNVKKETFTIIVALIAIVTFLVGIGVAWAATVSDVNYLKEQYKEAGPQHTEVINSINTRLDSCEKNIEVTKNDIGYIKSDVSEIKSDVKTLLSKQ